MTEHPGAVLEIGTQVGPYRIVGQLGGGGMGMVYRAVHTLLDRPAAIKVLRPELGNHGMAIDRFRTEARATTAIRHPGIVEIYDYGHTAGGNAYIAMELLEGRTLAARLADHAPLGLFEAMTLVRRIAAPLTVAHERGVVHRDLKPDNVFLVRDHEGGAIDQVKILDFGIAKLENTAAANRTTVGLVFGTPAYMSPEQCRGSSECDHRSDLYALGCILFELLAGQPPYGNGLSSGELLAAHLQSPVPDVTRFATVPSEIARLVTRLLAKRPDDRPGSALEVIADIDRWLATRPAAARQPRRLRRTVLVVAGMGLSFAVAGAGGLVWRGGPDATRASSPSSPPSDREPPAPPAVRSPAPVSPPPPVDPPVPVSPPAPVDPPARPGPSIAPARPRPHRASPAAAPAGSEVTSDLGSGSLGDVNTTVRDFARD
ncbi:MAG TPA: serine/threonine-protein kinase [Kofleriaceae bacterium]|jgi:serine/threonine-protein kinase|nr:serine/threonine-protein kinase [Kofleriaceae bacterium]